MNLCSNSYSSANHLSSRIVSIRKENQGPAVDVQKLLNKILAEINKHFEGSELIGNIQIIRHLKSISKLKLKHYKNKYLAEKIKNSLKRIYILNKSFEKTLSCADSFKEIGSFDNHDKVPELIPRGNMIKLPCISFLDNQSFISNMLSNKNFIDSTSYDNSNNLLTSSQDDRADQNKRISKPFIKMAEDCELVNSSCLSEICDYQQSISLEKKWLDDKITTNPTIVSNTASIVPTSQELLLKNLQTYVLKQPENKRETKIEFIKITPKNMLITDGTLRKTITPPPEINTSFSNAQSIEDLFWNETPPAGKFPKKITENLKSNDYFVGLGKPENIPTEENTVENWYSRKKENLTMIKDGCCNSTNENVIDNTTKNEQIVNTSCIAGNEFTDDLCVATVPPKYSIPVLKKMKTKLTNLNAQGLNSIFLLERKNLRNSTDIQTLNNLCNKLSSVGRKQLVKVSFDVGNGSSTYQEGHKDLVCIEEVVNIASDCLLKLINKISLQDVKKNALLNWPASEISTFSTQDQQKLFFWKDLSACYLRQLEDISLYFTEKLLDKSFSYFPKYFDSGKNKDFSLY